MNKLRKYVQECGGDIVYSDYDKVATLEDLEYNYRYIRFLLSPEAMFIKWLVDNDKIDYEKDRYGMNFYENGNQKFLSSEDEIIMELSIQDNPIEFLVSILK